MLGASRRDGDWKLRGGIWGGGLIVDLHKIAKLILCDGVVKGGCWFLLASLLQEMI